MVISLVAYDILSIVIGIMFEVSESEVIDQSSKYELIDMLLMLAFLF